MRLRLLAVARRPPAWVESALSDYARRLPRVLHFSAPLVPPAPGHNRNPARAFRAEGERLLANITRDETVVVLDEHGESWTSVELAARLEAWQAAGADLAFLVGGADGLAPACLDRADFRWSLSRLTLPHALVRVIVAEQLYRAISLNAGHPYHRS